MPERFQETARLPRHAGDNGDDLVDAIESLVPVGLNGLARMHDARSGLFSHKAFVGREGEVVNCGTNPLYSAAGVIGLLSRPEGRTEPYADIATRALTALLERQQERDPAVLATVLWACALAGRAEGERLAEMLVDAIDVRRTTSMQIGLALTGLGRWFRLRGDLPERASKAAPQFANELERRFIPSARVFAATGHHPRAASPGGLLTSFATQVYTVLGLTEFASLMDEPPRDQVAVASDFLVDSQGPLGQWWWFYSTRRAKVIEGYPVYSVHQDAMAIMALLPAPGPKRQHW